MYFVPAVTGRWTRTARHQRARTSCRARNRQLALPVTRLANNGLLVCSQLRAGPLAARHPVAVTEASAPTEDDLESNTYAAFADVTPARPKRGLSVTVILRSDLPVAFERRPAEELYDLAKITRLRTSPRSKLRGDQSPVGRATDEDLEGRRRSARDRRRPDIRAPAVHRSESPGAAGKEAAAIDCIDFPSQSR